MAHDKRWWATKQQIQWLLTWLSEYLEAQRDNKLHLFWPKLFAAWFKEFPCREPTDKDASSSEAEAESGSDVPPESADERAVALGKRKQQAKVNKQKKRAKKVCSISSFRLSLYSFSSRQLRLLLFPDATR